MRTIREKVVNSYFEALYAILGDSEEARLIMEEFPNVKSLNRAGEQELAKVEGIGKAKMKRLIGAIALSSHVTSRTETTTIHSPQDAADMLQYEMSMLQQEELRVILLNTRNHVIAVKTIYRGSLNSSQVRIGELFRDGIKENAAAILVVHNHPSGDPTPSLDDIAITKAIIKAGKLIDIQVLDHLVIGDGRFISMKKKGLGFNEEEV